MSTRRKRQLDEAARIYILLSRCLAFSCVLGVVLMWNAVAPLR